MQDDLSRLVGPEGFEVRRVIEVGDRVDLEVDLVARRLLPELRALCSTSRRGRGCACATCR